MRLDGGADFHGPVGPPCRPDEVLVGRRAVLEEQGELVRPLQPVLYGSGRVGGRPVGSSVRFFYDGHTQKTTFGARCRNRGRKLVQVSGQGFAPAEVPLNAVAPHAQPRGSHLTFPKSLPTSAEVNH